MDKKELNDLIDKVALTGPGGVDKIKKILKELVNENGGSSGGGSGCTCLPPMIVEGRTEKQNNNIVFIPNEGMPTYAEAEYQMLHGGLVFFKIDSGDSQQVCLATITGMGMIVGLAPNGASMAWSDYIDDGGFS